MKFTIPLSAELLQDVINIGTGLFSPLNGFMTSVQYVNVLERFCLEPGRPWPMPITLDVDRETFLRAKQAGRVFLSAGERQVGAMEIEDCFTVDLRKDCLHLFKTDDPRHPGVCRELRRSPCRIGGKINLFPSAVLNGYVTADQSRELFRRLGWQTVVGFQTRNPIHRAHEHLLRTALEMFDAVFINPTLGWKKAGDFSDEAVRRACKVMVDSYFPKHRVHFDWLRTSMRYAGPREALFHALIRRNAGCTHFIIGRDHAGVGRYYGTYEAQDLARRIASEYDLGIQLLLLKEPFYCLRCEQVVTELNCAHSETHKLEISGSIIRENLRNGVSPDERLMRKEVAAAILELGKGIFVQET
jgi:sulfate adenylyltransferase